MPLSLSAQDPMFTQFYAAPLYLNPAFSGAIEDTRVMLNYRNQWSGLEHPFSTFNLAFDRNFIRHGIGAGAYFMNDRGGQGNINRSDLGAMVSKSVDLNSTWTLRGGLQFSGSLRTADFSNLVFGDQLSFQNNNLNTSESFSNLTKFTPDAAVGTVFYSKKHWIGLAVHHLLRPNLGFFPGQNILQPMNFNLHAGTKIWIGHPENETSLSPCMNVRAQGDAAQLDLGTYFHKGYLLTGLWYRGLPVINKGSVINQDAIALLFGFRTELLSMAYSFDLPISKMIATTGSHEISVIYEFDILSSKKPKPSKLQKKLPCPRF